MSRGGETVLTATAFGRTVALRVERDHLDELRAWLPYWWADAPPGAEPEREWTLATDAVPELVVADLELWVAEHAEGLVFVHAGVVALDGRALLLPGRSFTGKTTMTRELLRAGAAYGSDEYAVLTPDGLVRAYPRPLALREGTRRRAPASEFGAAPFTGALPVGAVAVLRHAPGAELEITPISPATAVLRLFDNTVCASSRPAESFEALVAACRDMKAVEGTRGEAAAAVSALLDLLTATD